MVIRNAVLILTFLLGGKAIAGMPSDHASTAGFGLRVAPKSVEIAHNGAWSDRISGDETAEMCRSFLLRPTDVSEFFMKARRATQRQYSHDLVAANCYVDGKVRLAGGAMASWKIDQARRGFITMPDGTTIYLYCPACRAKALAPN